jgi:membrane associated rhomboid family serine protease|tara:strand:- start:8595 stop:9062 length:468 start_codon:yes stop_codon:yes gene_type:complete
MSSNKAFNLAQKVISGKIDLEMPLWTVILIGVIAAVYVSVTSIGMSVYDKCEPLKDSKMHQNLRNYLSYTLTIALTIPFTLLYTKIFSKDAAAFILLYSIMGIIGGAIAVNNAGKCPDVDKSVKTYNTVALTGFCATLLLSGLMIRSGVKKLKAY